MSGCGTLLGSGALGGRDARLALRRPRSGLSDGRDSLMLAIHPDARTTPAVRAEIARSSERSGVLAERYGISTETVRKWRKRGVAECRDRSSRPHKLPWKASEEERAVVCALRRATSTVHSRSTGAAASADHMAHHLVRLVVAPGHEVRLMSPEYVRPRVEAQKNDGRDAEGLAGAAT